MQTTKQARSSNLFRGALVLVSGGLACTLALTIAIASSAQAHSGSARRDYARFDADAHEAFTTASSKDPRAHQAIIGGSAAADGSFPSLAYILDQQGSHVYQCTGTVVAPSLVLTAGHCVESMQTGVKDAATGYRVVTGTVNPLQPQPYVSTVVGSIVYPGLRRRQDSGDAALLVLASPTGAPAISLASKADERLLKAGSPAVMAGWGLTSFSQTLLTEQLQSAPTVVQGDKWCDHNAPPFFPKSEICTINAPSYATGVCSGDSGGPLLVRSSSDGGLLEAGIAVHVYGQCSTHHPSVYVSVAAISRWVRTWIAAYARPAAPPSPTPPSPSTPSTPATPSPATPSP